MSDDDVTRDQLISRLESKRQHVVQQVEAMPTEARRSSQVPSGWTPLGLVHHLTHDVERLWLRSVMGGEEVDLSQGYDGWLAPADRTDEQVLAAYVDECSAATAAIATMSLDQPPAWTLEDGPPYSTLREVLLHVLVDTATHAGQLDICRELVDGGQHLVVDVPD